MMLAMQQSTLPHHDGHHVPSPTHPLVTLNPSSQSCLRPPSHTRSFKPKLSLNTSVESTHFRSSGKGASLRLDTLSAVSPTARNTFSNAYEQTHPQSTIQQRPKLSLNSAVGNADDFQNSPDHVESRTPSNASISSASTSSPDHFGKTFYELAPNVQSILINSIIPRQSPRKMSSPLRPSLLSKKVSFRDPLQEEIKTEKYIMAHSDLSFSLDFDNKMDSKDSLEVTPNASSSSPSPSKLVDSLVIQRSPAKSPVVEFQVPTAPTEPAQQSFSRRARRSSPRKFPSRRRSSPSTSTCQKRDSSDEDSDDAYPQTPVAGRAKRQREWVWTLGSLPGKDGNETKESDESRRGSADDDSHSVASHGTESSGPI